MTDRPAVLVTGGAGYIGSHCCSALHRAGFNPIAYDNLFSGHRRFVNWGPLVIGDLRDTPVLKSTLKQHRVLAAMHFAAVSSVSESVIDPGKYYRNNAAGTLSLLESMHATGCEKLVFSSTGAVYGETAAGLIAERAPCNPVNPYGRSKLMVEHIVEDFRRAHGLAAISLRYFNASGAESSGLIGELRDPETHLIPRALMKLQGYIDEFAVFGTDYDTPDGTAVRDYIHVVDLAEAHVVALKALLNGTRSGTFNLGTGAGYSVRDIVSAIERITKRKLNGVEKPRRVGDPAMLVADSRQMRNTLIFSHDTRIWTILFQQHGLGIKLHIRAVDAAEAVSRQRHHRSEVFQA